MRASGRERSPRASGLLKRPSLKANTCSNTTAALIPSLVDNCLEKLCCFFGESQVCLMDIGNNKRPRIGSDEQFMDLKSRNLDLSLRVSNLCVTLRIHDLEGHGYLLDRK